MADSVHRLPVPAKVRNNYRGHTIIVEFNPDTSQWHWSFCQVVEVTVEDEELTPARAIKSARRKLDLILGPKPSAPSHTNPPN